MCSYQIFFSINSIEKASFCCNLERIRNTLEFTYIYIYRHIYLEHAASALYNESKQKETSRKNYNINIIFYLRSSEAHHYYQFITQTISIT